MHKSRRVPVLPTADQHHRQNGQDADCGAHPSDEVGLGNAFELRDEVIVLQGKVS